MWMGVRAQRTSSRVARRLDAQRVRVEPGRERALLELHVWPAARPRRVAWREARRGSGRRVAPRDGARPPVRRPPLCPVCRRCRRRCRCRRCRCWRCGCRCRRCRRCRLLRATHLAGQLARRRSLLRLGLLPVELVAGRRPSACLASDARRGRCAAVAGTPLQGQQLGEDIGAAERRPSVGRLPFSFFWRGHRHVCGGDVCGGSGRGGASGGGGSDGRCTSGSTGRGNQRSSARSVRGARSRRTRGGCRWWGGCWRRGRPVARQCGSGWTCG